MSLPRLFAAWIASTLAVVASSTGLIDLEGPWKLNAGYVEDYTVAPPAPDGSFSVTCSSGPCSSWKTASITVTDASALKLAIAFDSGFKDVGVADSASATIISWSASEWSRPPAPPPPRAITVHVCPSTHMDPGWFQTVDTLYENLFKHTITNVTHQLGLNSSRTFVAEIAVVWAMFVGELGDSALATLRPLVASGQLEFVGGGWVQPDEAITRFEDLADQLTLGHLFVQSVLGHAPVRVGWSADPFGHGSTMAYISALSAYDAHVLGRPMSPHDPISTQGSVLWHPLGSAPDKGAFDPATTVHTYDTNGYWQPYRSMLGNLQPGAKQNLIKAGETLTAYVTEAALAKPYASNILVMLGDDAPLQVPWDSLYAPLDALLDMLNADAAATQVTYRYSTPKVWAAALAAESAAGNLEMPARPSWDMLPLVGNEFPYWVGYYTSRPNVKQTIHDGSAFFRGASMLHALARDDRTWEGGMRALVTLWRALGLVQHHDLITGDCYDPVATDIEARVNAGVASAALIASEAAALILNTDADDVGAVCTNLTMAPCAALSAALGSRTPTTVTFFNPLGWAQPTALINLIVPSADITVTDAATGAIVPCQTAAYSAPDLSDEYDWFSLAFSANLPPLGSAAYVLRATDARTGGVHAASQPHGSLRGTADPIVLDNGILSATFSANGTLLSLALAGGARIAAVAKLLYYQSALGHENAWDFSTDGSVDTTDFATTDAPAQQQQVAWLVPGGAGSLFSELAVSVDVAQGASLRYRLYSGESILHVFAATGPFSSANASSDAVLRIETDIASGGEFWTDSSGLELQRRQRWARPFTSLNYTNMAGNEPVAINMYPVTSTALIAAAASPENAPALAIVTANSHAVTSMTDGHIELSLNRNVLDQKGARFTANRLVTQHLLLAPAAGRAAAVGAAKVAAAVLANPPLAFAAAGVTTTATPPFAPLVPGAFPPQVAVVSLQLLPQGFNVSALFIGAGANARAGAPGAPASSGSLLLRLRHMYQAGLDAPALTVPVSVDLAAAFAPRWTVTLVTEMAVDATESLAQARARQVQWRQAPGGTESGAVAGPIAAAGAAPGATVVTLAPAELKTVWVQLQ